MLSRLGVDFDDGCLLEPTEFNPRGYFESQELNAVLDKQIQSIGGTKWQTAETPLIPEVEAYLRCFEDGKTLRGWKDPRLVTCGLPFVLALEDRGWDVRVVTTRRNPSATAKSLESWHKPQQASDLAGFLREHLLKTERALRRVVPVARVSYESVLKDPHGDARRLARFIGVSDGARIADAARSVDPSLNHHSRGGTP